MDMVEDTHCELDNLLQHYGAIAYEYYNAVACGNYKGMHEHLIPMQKARQAVLDLVQQKYQRKLDNAQ